MNKVLFSSNVRQTLFLLQEQEKSVCKIKKEKDEVAKQYCFMTKPNKTRVRGKTVKAGVSIKPGRQDGKLVIFERKCAYGDCADYRCNVMLDLISDRSHRIGRNKI